jgi:chromosome segregation ATPase
MASLEEMIAEIQSLKSDLSGIQEHQDSIRSELETKKSELAKLEEGQEKKVFHIETLNMMTKY